MARLAWNQASERFYETGVDRGVLYPKYAPGVAWSGLVSVDEAVSGGETSAYYLDGSKYLQVVASEDFQATLTAYSAPREFSEFDGTKTLAAGLFATQQPRKQFDFSYRTLIGNDVDGIDHGYKIHLVYNALASPGARTNRTVGDQPELNQLSWTIDTVPPLGEGYRPTAHLVVDSRDLPIQLLTALEDILYGTDTEYARFPSPQELVELLNTKPPVIATNYAEEPVPQVATATRGNIWKFSTDYFNANTGKTLETSGGPLGLQYIRKTVTTAGRVGAGNFYVGDNPDVATTTPANGGIPVVAGEKLCVSIFERNSVSTSGGFVWRSWRADGTSDNTFYGIGQTGTETFSNGWIRRWFVVTIPAGCSEFGFRTNTPGGTTLGQTFDITGLMVEKNVTTPSPFFYGDTPDTPGIYGTIYEWTGDPNNSTSVARSWG